MTLLPLAQLTGIDAAVVGLFLCAILVLGFSARLRDHSVLQYLAAGRQLTLPMFVATLVSTWYGGILGVSESVGYYGTGAWLLIGVPYYFFGGLYAVFFAGKVRQEAQISLPERLHARFGKATGLVGAVLLLLLAVPAAHVLMLGLLVSHLAGIETPWAIVAATLVGTLFLYRGGLLADVRVSILAFIAMYVGFAAMLGWCLTHLDASEIWRRAFTPEQLTLTGGVGPIQVVSFFILGAWTLVDPGFHQRVASAESPAASRKGLWICVACWFVFDLLSISTALYALGSSDGAQAEPLLAFPRFADQVLPPGLRGLFLCGLLGTILSAMVGYALVAGATLGREIVGRLRNAPDSPEVTRWSKIGVGVGCGIAVLVAIQVQSVVQLWYSWSGAVVGGLLIPVCMAYGLFPRSRVTGTAIWVSTALGSSAALGLMVYGLRTDNPYLTVPIGRGSDAIKVDLGTLVPGLAVSALTLGAFALLAIIRGKSHGRKRIAG
ncbi:MAG: hypothetical protein HZC36_03490 [Armatimonadetes bacterium]|nr:hypothetical protein [Armatimonadota bacterium]